MRTKVNSCRLISCALNFAVDRSVRPMTRSILWCILYFPTSLPLPKNVPTVALLAASQVGFFVRFLRSFLATCANSFSWKMAFAAFRSPTKEEAKGQVRNCAQNIYNHFGCYYFSAVKNFIFNRRSRNKELHEEQDKTWLD